MTAQDELARIDGQTLAVTSTQVGESPRVVATIPGTDGAVVLDSINGTATIVRPSGDSRRDPRARRRCSTSTASTSIRAAAYAVVWFDLAKAIAEGGITGSRQLPGRHRDRARAGRRACREPHRRVPPAQRAVRCGGQPRVRRHPGRRVGDRSRVRDRSRAEHRAADPGRRSERAARRRRGRHRRRPASTRRCVKPVASALRIVDVGSMPGRASRFRSRRRRPTSISHPNGSRVYAVAARRETARDRRRARRCAEPSGVETVDLTNATLGSLVLSRDGTPRAALHERDARRADHAGQARPAGLSRTRRGR